MMIEIISSPAHVAAFRLRDTVDASQYDVLVSEIENALNQHDEIAVLADMSAMDHITTEAIQRDLKYGLEKLSELHRFKRLAVVTAENWVENATSIVDSTFPDIEVRVFDPNEADEAMKWVSA